MPNPVTASHPVFAGKTVELPPMAGPFVTSVNALPLRIELWVEPAKRPLARGDQRIVHQGHNTRGSRGRGAGTI